MRESLKEYCSRHEHIDLLDEWHSEKNGNLTPDTVSYGSHKKVWWRCKRGHEWQSAPQARSIKGHGCPYCAGKKVDATNSLSTLYPDIAVQWHPSRNDNLEPTMVTPGSHRKVWWQCEHGHEWQTIVKSRVAGTGCPVCANKVVLPGINDLETCEPTLASQWHPEKNGSLKPNQVFRGSKTKVWWQCSRGHEWQASIEGRAHGTGCPVCAGKVIIRGENDLESSFPELAKEWDWEKNGSLRPDNVSVYSNRFAWWRCKLGHEWKCRIATRTSSKSGCPYCSGTKVLPGFNDLKTLVPLVAVEWHPTLNEGLDPTMVRPGSRKRVWWRCSEGHEWQAVIYARAGADKTGCPFCAGRKPGKIK